MLLTWFWSILLFTASAAAVEEASDPCRRFRQVTDARTGTTKLVRRLPEGDVTVDAHGASWSVSLRKVGGHEAAPLPAGAPVEVVLDDGARHVLRVATTTPARKLPTKYDTYWFWRPRLEVPADVAAKLAHGAVADVVDARGARATGLTWGRVRALGEAFRCADARLATAN